MDPVATLNTAAEAICEKDFPEAVARLGHYYHWRVTGGFEACCPEWGRKGDALAHHLVHELYDAMCTETIARRG